MAQKPTRTILRTVTVGTTPTQVAGNDPKRVEILLVNPSANVGYWWFDDTVSSSKGVGIAANGGSAALLYSEDRDLVKRAIYGISPTAAATWNVQEEVEE